MNGIKKKNFSQFLPEVIIAIIAFSSTTKQVQSATLLLNVQSQPIFSYQELLADYNLEFNADDNLQVREDRTLTFPSNLSNNAPEKKNIDNKSINDYLVLEQTQKLLKNTRFLNESSAKSTNIDFWETNTEKSLNYPNQDVRKDEEIVLANQEILSQGNSEIGQSATSSIFGISVIIYGGIFLVIIVQVCIYTETDINTIIAWIIGLFDPEKRTRKPKIKSSNFPIQSPTETSKGKTKEEKELELFLTLKKNLENKREQKLKKSIELFQIALNYKNSLNLIQQYESTYRGFKQQEFYNFIVETLANQPDFQQFKEDTEEKLEKILPQIKTDIGREALQQYAQEIYKIGSEKLGLKLIYLFKQYQMGNYSILDSVYDLINQVPNVNLLDIEDLNVLVKSNYESLEKFGNIIEISQEENLTETYSKIFQYLGLSYKHQEDY